MAAVTISTLIPGLLVAVKTSLSGNVRYDKEIIDPDHVTADGTRQARWETQRTIHDPAEFEAATKVRGRARTIIRGVCRDSSFGLLCPQSDGAKLDLAVADARKIVSEFNAGAKLTRLHLYVLAGRIAPDDVEAVKAINSDVRDLMADMAVGIKNLDVKVIRDAAGRANKLATMLSPDAAARVQVAIDVARAAAKRIVAVGEQAAQEIDQRTIRTITEARTSFLDLDPGGEIKTPVVDARALDLVPQPAAPSAATSGVTVRELEF